MYSQSKKLNKKVYISISQLDQWGHTVTLASLHLDYWMDHSLFLFFNMIGGATPLPWH